MTNNEEYLLRVLHRTYKGLQDSLIPAHGVKLTKLLQVLEQAPSLTDEVKRLANVQGFTKCALAMEWLLERSKDGGEEFSLEQFESDILLLNEKLFEAFLNQPFDMPDFGGAETASPARRPIQQNIQASADEFIPASVTPALQKPLKNKTEEKLKTEPEQTAREPKTEWTVPISTPKAFEAELISTSPAETGGGEAAPPLADAMDADLYETVERIAQNIAEFSEKQAGERPIAMAVIRVAARTANEAAQAAGNQLVGDFFAAFLKLISYADEQGKIRTDAFAEIMHDIGDRLAIALKQPSGGVALLKNLITFIGEPKDLFSK